MKEILQKLQDLSLTLPSPPTPLASYIPATRADNFIYVSGQLPISGDYMPTGRVPDVVSKEAATDASVTCFLNVLAAALPLLHENETLKLVQLQGFVQSAPDFYEQPSVIDGASTLAVQLLEENGKHARIAVGVNVLPNYAPVEIFCTFLAVPSKIRFLGRYRWFDKKSLK